MKEIQEIVVVDILKDGEFVGHSPIIKRKGMKPTMHIKEDGEPLVFDKLSDALDWAINQIKSER